MTELAEGCIVRYMGKHGMKAGYYARTLKNGKLVLRVPEDSNRLVPILPSKVLAIRPAPNKTKEN